MALRTGIVTEPASARSDVERVGARLAGEIHRRFGRSLAIREVDAGSCNGCGLEIAALPGPHYDLERFGLSFVAPPRPPGCLPVTGPVARHTAGGLRRTGGGRADPKLGIRAGGCGS